jgi:superoxide oxidase
MADTPPPDRYALGLASLHWLMAALIIALIVVIEAREFVPRDNPLRADLKSLHFSLGLSALVFLIARLGLRAATTIPAITPKPPVWQIGLSHLIHLLLYALMLALPILGWVALSALGKDISVFGLHMPPLIAEDREFGHTLEEAHKLAGNVMMYLIGLHAAAALFHHVVVKDNTLMRMLPGR